MMEAGATGMAIGRGKRRPNALWTYLVLSAGIWLVYWPVTRFDFVNFDDHAYVVNNPIVRQGITGPGLKWAWSATVVANWHPLTLISHMLDCQIFGNWAGGHHLTNILFHTANSCLLFFLVARITGRPHPSFLVAALFAWHPAHVESVAWIAERKDVLSTFFGLLATLAYVRFANSYSKYYYALALLLFALGLMSKPMLVTLPFILLLLDYWPLGRLNRPAESKPNRFKASSWPRLLLEKLPFLALTAVSCLITLWAQKNGGAIVATESLPVSQRVANAVFSYWRYLGLTVWPTKMAAYYPYVTPTLNWLPWLAGTGLMVITVGLLVLRRFPFLTVGWLWFLGTLIPVIGLVQVGGQGMADRYTYIPSVGLFIMAAFGLGEMAGRLRHGNIVLTMATTVALAGCLIVTSQQVWSWRNSETLNRHAIAVTTGNYAACNNLGVALVDEGHAGEAVEYYKQAIAFLPNYIDAYNNLGSAYRKLNRPNEAFAEFRAALKINPQDARSHYLLASELMQQGDLADAELEYRTSISLRPDRADAHYELATVLMARGEIQECRQQYREALKLSPEWLEALNNLSWSIATQGDSSPLDLKDAVKLAMQAVALTHTNQAGALDTLAAAYAANDQFQDAIATGNQALKLAQTAKQTQMAQEIEGRLRLYKESQPFRETALPAATKPSASAKD